MSSEDYQIDLTFQKEALDEIAAKAFQSKTGARSLRKIIDDILEPTFQNHTSLHGTNVHITKEFVEQMLPSIQEKYFSHYS